MEIFQTLAIAVPSRLGMLIPDLLVAPVLECAESDSHISAALAETPSSRSPPGPTPATIASASPPPTPPPVSRCTSWSTAGPPGGPTATLYGEPKGDVYRVLKAVKFGDLVELPEPFGLTVDTSEFPVD
ncbi:hypothetical protein SCANM63S_07490 [Streptomyces canarius]